MYQPDFKLVGHAIPRIRFKEVSLDRLRFRLLCYVKPECWDRGGSHFN
jgi:hypothetical protein